MKARLWQYLLPIGFASLVSTSAAVPIEIHFYGTEKGNTRSVEGFTQQLEAVGLQASNVFHNNFMELQNEVGQRLGVGYPPDMTQWIAGTPQIETVRENISSAATSSEIYNFLRENTWPDIFEEIYEDNKFHGLPLSIHLRNMVIYNKTVLRQYGYEEFPKTLAEFTHMLRSFTDAQRQAIASSLPVWLVEQTFYGLLISVAGVEAHDNLTSQAVDYERLSEDIFATFEVFALLRDSQGTGAEQSDWHEAARQVGTGQAAFMMDGDRAWSTVILHGGPDNYGCAMMPEISSVFYTIDVLVPLETNLNWGDNYINFTKNIMTADFQLAYNAEKSGVPAFRHLRPEQLTQCAEVSLNEWLTKPRIHYYGKEDTILTIMLGEVIRSFWVGDIETAEEAVEKIMALSVRYDENP